MARNAIAAVSIALLSLGAAGVAQAQTSATVVIQSGQARHYQTPAPVVVQHAPPPARYEAVPRPRPRRNMVWVPGHWIKARPGYHYREPRWVEHGGRWELRAGRWDRDGVAHRRDRDGDGVPNRHDRRPDNPYRQ